MTDATAVYAALATVGAITSGLQGSAALASTARVNQLESGFDATRPRTNERQQAAEDAKSSRPGIVIVNVASAVVCAAVLLAWGDVVFARMTSDWVFIVPWFAIAVAALAVSYVGVIDLCLRLNAVVTESRGQ